jgi:hypothetical protein
MGDLACTVANGCVATGGMTNTITPLQYQGWFLLLFLVFGTVAILYVFYKIAIIPDAKPITTPSRKRK